MNYAISSASGRALIAALFIMGGTMKIASPEGTIQYISAMGLPLPTLAYAGAVFAETAIVFALLIGFQTRVVAVFLALFTLATAAFFHNDFADQSQMIHFMKNLAIIGGLLQVAALGGGALSIDGFLARRRMASSQMHLPESGAREKAAPEYRCGFWRL